MRTVIASFLTLAFLAPPAAADVTRVTMKPHETRVISTKIAFRPNTCWTRPGEFRIVHHPDRGTLSQRREKRKITGVPLQRLNVCLGKTGHYGVLSYTAGPRIGKEVLTVAYKTEPHSWQQETFHITVAK